MTEPKESKTASRRTREESEFVSPVRTRSRQGRSTPESNQGSQSHSGSFINQKDATTGNRTQHRKRKTGDDENRQQRKWEKEREKELGVQRQGIADRMEGLSILASGLPLYAPQTQVYPTDASPSWSKR